MGEQRSGAARHGSEPMLAARRARIKAAQHCRPGLKILNLISMFSRHLGVTILPLKEISSRDLQGK